MERQEIVCPAGAAFLMEKLEAAGYEAYVVGGCVRDALLGKDPHDWDITTSASPEEVKSALSGTRLIDTGLKHGTVTAVLEEPYEITTFRVDGIYSDGRRPDSVRFSRRLEDDLSRRDFTINAMAYHPRRGLVDAFHGAEDLRNGIIRCVGNPEERMGEDALRVMRAVRFQSRFGFSIEPETMRAVKDHLPRLALVSAERIGSEFRKIVSAPHAAQAVRENPELFCLLVPALRESMNCPQNNPYHTMNVFNHTLAALEAAGRKDGRFPAGWADEEVRLALFFHDLGKPACRTVDEAGVDHFYGHAKKSVEIARTAMRAMRFSNELTDTVAKLIELHDAGFSLRRPGVRRWMARLPEEQIRRLLKVKECDIFAHSSLAGPQLEDAAAFWAMVQALQGEPAAHTLRELAVNGRDLMEAGIPAGAGLGAILNALLNEVMDEKLSNERPLLLRRALEMQSAD